MITKEREDEFWYLIDNLIDNDLIDEVKLKFSEEEIKFIIDKFYEDYKPTRHCESWSSPFLFNKNNKQKVEDYKPNVEPDEFLDSLD